MIAFSLPAGARGHFARWTATLYAEGGELSRGRVQVMIDASSVEGGGADRDALAAELLDAANHPEIRFRSTHVKVLKRDRLRIAGVLEMRGVTREVVLFAKQKGRTTDPWGNERMGFTATASLDPAAFGMPVIEGWQGVAIDIDIEVEAVKQPKAKEHAA